MFRHRHQFDVRKTHLHDIGHQPFGQRIPARRLTRARPEPRRGMHFIDTDRGIGSMARGARFHPCIVVPDVGDRVHDDGGRCRRRLSRLRQRVGLIGQSNAVPRNHGEFVSRARPNSRHEQLPNPGGIAQPHRVAPVVPGIEVANHRDRPRVRRPDREPGAANAIHRHRVGAQREGEFEQPPFIEQM